MRRLFKGFTLLNLQMTETNDIKILTPGAKSVPSYMVPQTSLLGLNFDRPNAVRSQAAGMMIITMTSAMMLNVEPALLTSAIQRVGNEAMKLWMIMRKQVSRKT